MNTTSIGTLGYRQLDDIWYSCTVSGIHDDQSLDLIYSDDGKLESKVPLTEFQSSPAPAFDPLPQALQFLDTMDQLTKISVSKHWQSLILDMETLSIARESVTEDQLRQLLHLMVKQRQYTTPVPIKYLITRIHVMNSGISDDLLMYLLRNCPKVVEISCIRCHSLTDGFLKALMNPSFGKTLERLDFWMSRGISVVSSKQLKQIRPNCVIESSGMIPLTMIPESLKLQEGINLIEKRVIVNDLLTNKSGSAFYLVPLNLINQTDQVAVMKDERGAFLFDSIDAMKRQVEDDPSLFQTFQPWMQINAAPPSIHDIFNLEGGVTSPVLVKLNAQREAMGDQLEQLRRRVLLV